MSAAAPGIVVTEESLVATIAATGVILAALITTFGTVFVSIAQRARRAAEAGRHASEAGKEAAEAAKHEMFPNSGGSFFDKVAAQFRELNTKVDERFDDVNAKLDSDNNRLGALEGRVGDHIRQSEIVIRSLKKQQGGSP